jgi:hypothetical protein
VRRPMTGSASTAQASATKRPSNQRGRNKGRRRSVSVKIIDVTLASIENVGNVSVAPKGVILCQIIRAIDDKQIFQSESLYFRQTNQPMHPSGATHIPPGESLSFNVMKRLTVSQFEVQAEGQLNQSLMFATDMTEDLVVSGNVHVEHYQGSFNFKVRFDEIDGFNTVTCDYKAFTNDLEAKIIVTYTVNLVSSSEDDRVREKSLVDVPRYSSE